MRTIHERSACAGRSSTLSQFSGMLRRQVLIKIRDRRRTLAEIFFPIYSLIVPIIILLISPNPNYPQELYHSHNFSVFNDLHRIVKNGCIAIVPNTELTRSFSSSMNQFYLESGNESQSLTFTFFNSSKDMESAYFNKSKEIHYAIIFYNVDNDIKYDIRTNQLFHPTPLASKLFSTEPECRSQLSQMEESIKKSGLQFKPKAHDMKQDTNISYNSDVPGECSARKYLNSGFVALQYLVEATFLNNRHNGAFRIPEIKIQRLPKGKFVGGWLIWLRLVAPVYMMIYLSQFMAYLIIHVVGEKESKLKEGMKIMGLRDCPYWLSWFVVYGMTVTFHTTLGAVLLYWLKIFQHTNFYLLYLLLMSYSFSLISFSFLISSFFDRASSAGITASFSITIVSCLYFLQLFVSKSSNTFLMCMCLISSAGFTFGMDQAFVMELAGPGLQWSNIWSTQSSALPFGYSLLMIVIDTLLYGILGFYLDNVLPSKHGLRKPIFFFLKASYWNDNKIRKCYVTLDRSNSKESTQIDNIEFKPFDVKYNNYSKESTLVINEVENNTIYKDNREEKMDNGPPSGQEPPYKVSENYNIPNYGIVVKKEAINLNNNYDIELGVRHLSDGKDNIEQNSNHFKTSNNISESKNTTNTKNTIPSIVLDQENSNGPLLDRDRTSETIVKIEETSNTTTIEEETSNVSAKNGKLDQPISNKIVEPIKRRVIENGKTKLVKDTTKKRQPLTLSSESANENYFQADIEPVSRDLYGREAIDIRNLSKSFTHCRKPATTALDKINLTIYEGQITAILGHNGAGKTTLFNILTGLTLPTSGTAYIYGYDIRDPDGMTIIRRMIGVCPQSDLLFTLLTPQEHLEFYATLKGIPKHRRLDEIQRTLKEVDLNDKTTVLTKYLSGGQRRKLSVAIAILGDPKIIILDEPTAGIDPYSRRHMWSILQRKSAGRVILLTTHFMDEADILADRKAVISKGLLRCCGSSLFLKNKFGIGYHLTLVLDSVAHEESIARLILEQIPRSERTRRHGKELSYILPYDSVPKFASLFAAIENETSKEENRLGIQSYGISMTSLEEVFLQLEKDEEEHGNKVNIENISKEIVKNKNKKKCKTSKKYSPLENESNDSKDKSSTGPDTEKSAAVGIGLDPISIDRSNWKTFVAITHLRIIRLFRDVNKLILMIVIPMIFAAIGMNVHKNTSTGVDVTKKLPLTTDSYNLSHKIAIHLETFPKSEKFGEPFVDNDYFVPYNGNYSSLLPLTRNSTPLLGALNIVNLNNFTVLYNDTFIHSLPIMLNTLDNAISSYLSDQIIEDKRNLTKRKSLKKYLSNIRPKHNEILATSEPLPLTDMTVGLNFKLFSLSMFLGMVFVMIPINMSVELVQDRENKSKNQLRVNGLSAVIYFLSYFVTLIALIIFLYLGLLLLIYIFDLSILRTPTSLLVMSFLVLLSTPPLILFCTIISYFFNSANSARSIMPNFGSMFAIIPLGLVFFTNMFNIGGNIYHYLHTFFCLFDTIYTPYSIIYFLSTIHINCELKKNCDSLSFWDYLRNVDVQSILISLISTPVFFVLLIYLDIKKTGTSSRLIFKQLFNKAQLAKEYQTAGVENVTFVNDDEEVDEDIRNEKIKVNNIVKCNDVYNQPAVLVQNLTKIFKKGGRNADKKNEKLNEDKVAVKNLNLCIDQGEVFGLLGHNGAGKTTTLKIITYEEMPTSGTIQIGGYNIVTNFGSIFEHLGYCPQHNALWNNITLREHLNTYAAIRGVPKYDIPRLTNSFIDGLHIRSHADKQVFECSGGTKRKLSFALAMIGNPKIVLLDEPSTGMDPKSKRFLWDTILASFQGSRGAILTTHSMEEADALCSRVGIMVRGELKCIGSTQHLKNRYGAGYTMEIKLKMSADQHSIDKSKMAQIKTLVDRMFTDSTLEEEFADRVVFSVPQSSVRSLAQTFDSLERAKRDFDIEEYSFSQTTLEQVYIKFAQRQRDADESNKESQINKKQ